MRDICVTSHTCHAQCTAKRIYCGADATQNTHEPRRHAGIELCKHLYVGGEKKSSEITILLVELGSKPRPAGGPCNCLNRSATADVDPKQPANLWATDGGYQGEAVVRMTLSMDVRSTLWRYSIVRDFDASQICQDLVRQVPAFFQGEAEMNTLDAIELTLFARFRAADTTLQSRQSNGYVFVTRLS